MAEGIVGATAGPQGPMSLPPSRPFDPIEFAGKVLALVTVLLPVGGFVERWIAYQIPFGETYWAIPMAWSAPLPQLALTGLLSMFFLVPPVALVAELVIADALLERLSNPIKKRFDKYSKRGIMSLLVGLLIASLAYALFFVLYVAVAPDWPLSGFAVVITLIAVVGSRITWRSKARRRFRDIWWVVLVAIVLSNAATGITGSVNGKVVATYQFDPGKTSLLSDGQYQNLGEDGGFAYLQKCGSSDVYRVNEIEIVAVKATSRPSPHMPGPSLVDVLLGATPGLGAELC